MYLEIDKKVGNVIFFKLKWGERYQGDEELVGEGKGDEEVLNFQPHNNKCYSYVANKIPNDELGEIHIEKLGVSKSTQLIKGVTIVFTSKRDNKSPRVIIGWYANATLYRKAKYININGYNHTYYAKARARDCFCIPSDKRLFDRFPSRNEGGFGRSHIWYANGHDDFKKIVLEYIENYHDDAEIEATISTGHIIDPEKRKKIEKIAVDLATQYYFDKEYDVKSVEAEGCGWDLTATKLTTERRIEVKGTQNKDSVFELTQNEYKKMQECLDKYRIAVVTSCLDKPILHIYKISKKGDFWYNIHNKTDRIVLEEKIAVYAQGKPKNKF